MESQRLTETEAFLNGLRKERDRLNKVISVLEDYLYEESGETVGVPLVPKAQAEMKQIPRSLKSAHGEFAGMTVHDAAKKFLEQSNSPQTTRQVYEALTKNGLPDIQYNATYTALWRRVVPQGDFLKLGESLWGLVRHDQSSLFGTHGAGVGKKRKKTSSGRKRRKPSQLDYTEGVLRDLYKPAHLTLIISKLAELGKPTTVHSLSSTLRQDTKKRFENMGGNVWVLAEWPDSIKNKENA